MRHAAGPVFQGFELDPAASMPLHRQLHGLLRDALLSGALPAGSRLPSTRALAADLGLSRNTVTTAFDHLHDEGLIESRIGDGTYASRLLGAAAGPHRATRPKPEVTPDDPPDDRDDPSARSVSRRGRTIARSVLGRDPQRPLPFALGVPALDAFPLRTWRRILTRRARSMTATDLAHGPPAGDERLRGLIARHLATARGVRCSAEQVLILPSAQLGLDLAGRVLLDPGDAVWIENPGYLGARGAFRAAGARLVPVPVDDDGLRVDDAWRLDASARLAYVTPSHQFPLGASMSLERRLQLLAWAEEDQAWIVEDDYDSEYRYDGKPAQALQGLDRADRVLYLGTFSKVVFPALRLAYLVVPERLIELFRAARFLLDGHVAPSTQAAVADFMEGGHMVAHLRRMRTLYRTRRDVLLDEVARRFGGLFRFSGAQAGLHVTARLAHGDDRVLAARAPAHSLDLAPLSRYLLDKADDRGLRGRPMRVQGIAFGYGHVPPEEILAACDRLETLLASHR
ncbi:MAG: PLP-dependent aminotransferase family protein [Acidobacteriota bacterium]